MCQAEAAQQAQGYHLPLLLLPPGQPNLRCSTASRTPQLPGASALMSGPTLATVSLLGPEVSHLLWLPQPGQACHTPTHGRLGGEGALPLLALSPCAGHEQKRQSPPLSPGPHASQAPAGWPALQLEAVSRMNWAFYQGQCRDYSASQRADILSWPHPQPPSQTHCSTAGSGWGLLAPWRGPP